MNGTVTMIEGPLSIVHGMSNNVAIDTLSFYRLAALFIKVYLI